MNKKQEIYAGEVVAMYMEREKEIQKQEQKYWCLFGEHITAVKQLYREGHTGGLITKSNVNLYTEAQHFLYWKRVFGNMVHSVRKESKLYELHIIFHLE